jgi:hypothetical protein
VSGQRHAPAALYPRKGPPVPFVQEAEWAPELVWTQRLDKNSFRLCRGSNLYKTWRYRLPIVVPLSQVNLRRSWLEQVFSQTQLKKEKKIACLITKTNKNQQPVFVGFTTDSCLLDTAVFSFS